MSGDRDGLIGSIFYQEENQNFENGSDALDFEILIKKIGFYQR